jgi:hypothetical protein
LPFASATAIPGFHPPCRGFDDPRERRFDPAALTRARARGFLRETASIPRPKVDAPLNESSLFRHSGHARKQNRTARPGLSG